MLDQAEEMIRDWTAEERVQLRDEVPRLGLETPFRNRTVRDLAKDMVALSREGLKRRARLNDGGQDERVHLAAVEETLASGMTPADVMLRRYHGEWGGDLSKVFQAYAY